MVARLDLTRLATMLLLAAWFACAASARPPTPPNRVLLVYYNDGAFPAYVTFEQSLVQGLHAALGPNLEFYREQVDATRFPASTAHRIEELRLRYAERKIDVVIFFGNIPTIIVPGVPVVQVDNALPERTVNNAYGGNVVHVMFNIDFRKTADVARRLQPKAHKLLLISGFGPGERVDLEQARKQLLDEPQLHVQVINNASIEELCRLVSHLSRDTIVFPISYERDRQGNSYLPRDVVARLAAASTAPVYAISDTYIGRGTVGGYAIRWETTGELVADAAVQLIRGKAPSEVVLKSPGSGFYMFDWRQLKRWRFSERDLPPDSIVEYKVPTAWEQYRWHIVGSSLVTIVESFLIVAMLIQRYQRKRAEGSLRDMAGRLLQSQDDERRRIARDLHDGIGQNVSGIALSVGQVLADFPPGYDRLRQLLEDSHVASRQALDEVRAVSYALHPPILDGLGLTAALRWYLDGLQKRTSFHIDFDVPADFAETTPDAKRTLFRITQESVTNALRHSGGTAMKVRLFESGKSVMLEIEDNGRGMSAEELERAEGAAVLGVGIAVHVPAFRQFHGTFKINSGPGGTRVLVSMPRFRNRYVTHTAC